MKYRKFQDVKGRTDEEKLTTLFKESTNGRILVQPKLNGVHCKIAGGKVYSRDNKPYNLHKLPQFLVELAHISEDKSLVIHGELTNPNISFQELCGRVSVNANEQYWNGFELNIFDVGYLNDSGLYFEERFDRFTRETPYLTEVQYVETRPVTTVLAADAAFKEAVSIDLEGIIYRLTPCIYDPTLRVHPDIIKRKRLHHAEGVCVGVFEGKGKRAGILGSMMLRLPTGKYLLVGGGAGMTDLLLEKLYKNPPIHKTITFSYEDISTSGVPLRPQFVAVRDYE